MPLVRITLATGRTATERRAIADGVHNALVQTANVPADDRFQIVQEVPKGALVWDAGYLGFARTAGVVFVEITLNAGRTVEVKKALYAAIAARAGPRRRSAAGRRAGEPGGGPARELVLRRRPDELSAGVAASGHVVAGVWGALPPTRCRVHLGSPSFSSTP